ncbi:MAG: peptide ABC transporter permease, partial [Zetaproteobacteria bacterium CG02_land_8_20_14_3_00_50_9]
MRYLFSMAWHSAWNRRFTLGLTLLSIALSVTLLLGVERIRHDARQAFAQSVSGTDLVIGARTSPVQLMLYSVFHIGEATNNIHWQAYQEIAANPTVAWSIPISLGDSHRGFPVLGTHAGYFEHFHYGNRQSLTFETGKPFDGVFDTVIGSEVAASLGYHPGDHIVLTHGAGGLTGQDHNDKPFVVTGILAPTGTPVDRTVHVSLEAIEAIHLDWQGGARMPGFEIPAEYVRKFDLTPKSVTAILIGLKSRAGVFRMQRLVNDYADEPLL